MSFKYSGSTALITGASSGIGEAFAKALAERGMNLIIVARSEDLLHQLAGQLNEQFGVRVDVFSSDLSDEDGVINVIDACAEMDLHVDLLINNAGFGNIGPYEEQDEQRERDMVMVNVLAVNTLCRAFIPPMVDNGFGGVINVASTAAYQPMPYLATYGASKAFVKSLTLALWAEFQGRGVHVMELSPGPVQTNFAVAAESKYVPKDIMKKVRGMTPERLVADTLAAFDKGLPRVIPGGSNKAMAFFGAFVPNTLLSRVLSLGLKKAL